jgi:molybdate transport system substrate-binding protein
MRQFFSSKWLKKWLSRRRLYPVQSPIVQGTIADCTLYGHLFRTLLFLLSSMLLLTGCNGDKALKNKPVELVMFCAAGLKEPVTRIAEAYEKETGAKVQLQFGGSGGLLSSLQIAPGDIFLAADSSYTDEAKTKGLVTESWPVAQMKAGFGVPRGNPKGLTALADLKKAGIRVGIGNPEAASIGKFTRKILSQHGAWEGLVPTVSFPTVNELANAIILGTVDVVIIWDAVAAQTPEVEFVSLPEFDVEKVWVSVAVTSKARDPEAARKFCLYLNAADKGAPIFRKAGFEVPGGE